MVSFAFVGPGSHSVVPAAVITEGLNDLLAWHDNEFDGDDKPTFLLPWYGIPGSNMETLYDYVLDMAIPFKMYYEKDAPPNIFESEGGEMAEIIKTSDVHLSMAAEGPTTVVAMFPMDDHDDEVIDAVSEVLGHCTTSDVRDLTAGLVPMDVPSESDDDEETFKQIEEDIEAEKEELGIKSDAPEEVVENDVEDIGDDLGDFSKEDLEGLSFKLLKRAAQGRTDAPIRDKEHAISILLGEPQESSASHSHTVDTDVEELKQLVSRMQELVAKL